MNYDVKKTTITSTAFEHFIEFFIETFANIEEAATDPKIEKNKLF